MADLPFDLRECTAKFTSENHYEYPDRMRYLDVVARHSMLGELAKMRCMIISRRKSFKTHSDFLEITHEESHELMEFSSAVFDARSNVQRWLLDGGYKSGSGCWGTELNEGPIVHFEDLIVQEQFRNRGIGSLVLQQFCKSSFVDGKTNIFCWPFPKPARRNDESDKDWRTKVERLDRFFRRNGFRRIGRTAFFGYSINPTHPSRQLPIENDLGFLGDDFPDMSSLSIEQATLAYPLHVAIDDKEETPNITNILTAAHALDPAKIHQPDIVGYTLLHVAAVRQNLPALRTLLDLGVADDLRNTSNKDHLTPLEILQDKMLLSRKSEETTRGKWDGYLKETLVCEYLLKKALGMPLMAESEEEYVVKARLGCTCGSCADQWLSGTMTARLHLATEVACEVMDMEFDQFLPSKPLSAEQTSELANASFLPPALRYYSMFVAISQVLQDEADGIPTSTRVLAQARATGSNISYYIKNGGLVKYALDAIVTIAQEQVVDGDDSFDDLDEADGGKCANDLAFTLVRYKLGLEQRIFTGSLGDY